MSPDSEVFFTDFIFDLDDTLLDTSGVLIPLATEMAVKKMFEKGLSLKPKDAARVREQILHDTPRALVFREIALKYTPIHHPGGAPLQQRQSELEQIGLEVFLSPPLDAILADPKAAFVHGADRLLDSLRGTARLHLVTAGLESSQLKKVSALGIQDCFATVIVVAPERGSKAEAYRAIQANWSRADVEKPLEPKKVLVVGNRVDTDLAPGKQLGFRTAWIRHGEHKLVEPVRSDEIPDFEFRTPMDLFIFLQQGLGL